MLQDRKADHRLQAALLRREGSSVLWQSNRISFVYVMEAHASDEWPLGKREAALQHKNIRERIKAAEYYRKVRMSSSLCSADPNVLAASKAPFACDSMRNTFYETFGAWPEGHVVINSNNRLVVSTQAIYGSGEIKVVCGGKLLSKHLLTTWSATQANHITRTPSDMYIKEVFFL